MLQLAKRTSLCPNSDTQSEEQRVEALLTAVGFLKFKKAIIDAGYSASGLLDASLDGLILSGLKIGEADQLRAGMLRLAVLAFMFAETRRAVRSCPCATFDAQYQPSSISVYAQDCNAT